MSDLIETPPREAFNLSEAIELEEGVFNDDGTVNLHILRPCVGKGKGRHVYEADMLRENAHKFGGWRMFKNHLSEQARRALGGLPRPIEHIGGRVIESVWDGDVPPNPEKGWGQGAVIARVKPLGEVRALIEEDPELIEASINAKATAVRPVMRDGQRAWLVEGIEENGSVDWVTEAGAGGRVASLVESVYHTQEDVEMALLESMNDEELVATLREQRPGLMESLVESREAKPEAKPEAVTPEAKPEPVKPESKENENVETTPDTRETLTEALATDEGKALLQEAVQTQVTQSLEFERALLRAEANAEADRKLALRDMRDSAHSLIEAARLPDEWTAELKGKYALAESGAPSTALDVLDEIDDEGTVTKSAQTALREAVVADIAHQRELIAAARPTRIAKQGPRRVEEAKETDPEAKTEEKSEKTSKKGDQALWERTLQEAGFDDPAGAYSDE